MSAFSARSWLPRIRSMTPRPNKIFAREPLAVDLPANQVRRVPQIGLNEIMPGRTSVTLLIAGGALAHYLAADFLAAAHANTGHVPVPPNAAIVVAASTTASVNFIGARYDTVSDTELRTRANCGSGSSPRVRGTRRKGVQTQSIRRFIPARAGNAREHEPDRRQGRFIPARAGNAAYAQSVVGLCRFIPARAGNAFVAD